MDIRFNVSRISYLLTSHFCFFSLAYSNPRLGHEDKYDTMVVVAATLAALLFIALIALAVVLFLWRKTRQSNGNLIVQLNTVSLIDVDNFNLDYFLLLAVFLKGIRARRDSFVVMNRYNKSVADLLFGNYMIVPSIPIIRF